MFINTVFYKFLYLSQQKVLTITKTIFRYFIITLLMTLTLTLLTLFMNTFLYNYIFFFDKGFIIYIKTKNSFTAKSFTYGLNSDVSIDNNLRLVMLVTGRKAKARLNYLQIKSYCFSKMLIK